MKTTNLTKWAAAIGCTCVIVLTPQVSAITTLSIGDGRELGFVDAGLPAGDGNVTSYVNQLISMGLNTETTIDRNEFTRSSNAFGSLPAAVLISRTTYGEISASTVDIDVGSVGYDYLLAKYAGPNYGSEVWYIGGLSGIIRIPSHGGKYGISGTSLFTDHQNVPDRGATLVLLGLGFSGLGMVRSRIARE